MIMRYKNDGEDDENPGNWDNRMKTSLHVPLQQRGDYSGLIGPSTNRLNGGSPLAFDPDSVPGGDAPRIIFAPVDKEEVHKDAMATAQSVINCSGAFNGEALRGGRLEVPLRQYLNDRIAFRDASQNGDVNASMPVRTDIMHALLQTAECSDSSKRQSRRKALISAVETYKASVDEELKIDSGRCAERQIF